MSSSLWKLFSMSFCSSMSICSSHGLVGRGVAAASDSALAVAASATGAGFLSDGRPPLEQSLSSLTAVAAELLCWLTPSRSDPLRLSCRI